MINYNLKYSKYIVDETKVTPTSIMRGKFYMIREYNSAEGEKLKYTELKAPIIFVLFVSKPKDIVHAIKISNINPIHVKKFFGRLLNEDTEKLSLARNARKVYNEVVKKVPIIRENAYRTYNLSGIKRIMELEIEIEDIVPRHKLKDDE